MNVSKLQMRAGVYFLWGVLMGVGIPKNKKRGKTSFFSPFVLFSLGK